MTPRLCPHQAALLSSLRTGGSSAALEAHRAQCEACRECAAVAILLLAHAANLSATPPSAAVIWHHAQAQRRANALRRTARILAAMRTLGAIYLLALVAWCLRSLWIVQPRIVTLTLATAPIQRDLAVVLVLLSFGASALLLLGRRKVPILLR